MTTVLVGSASVHTTAAACDYLGPRLGPEDRVVIVGVASPGMADRDVGDAANVARTRLVEPAVETAIREGNPGDALLAAAREFEADEILLGATRGDPDAAGEPPGSTVTAMLAANEFTVTVLPSPAP
jgi:nucleotide-binding universal stress UspA family protein